MTDAWHPDVLGGDWVARTMPLRPNAEGEVVATLVTRRATLDGAPAIAGPAPGAPTPRAAVLYVHGFVDYFFQTHLARQFADHGIDFFAIDLHGYGRSLLPHQRPNFCMDLREYGEELAAATWVVRGELGYDRLVLMGHSTGGLIASLWAHSATGRETVDALVLNSPFLDLNRPFFDRVIGTAVLDVVGGRARYVVVQHAPSEYSRSLHREAGGEWEYDRRLKPPEGFAVLAGWLRAIRAGQARLARGLDLACPVLVCTSTRSGANRADNRDLHRVDVILDVDQIARRAPALGTDVTVVQIDGGIHDLALSPEPARTAFFAAVFGWLEGVLGGVRAPTQVRRSAAG
ncbi:Lysophospholipase, alpha-beta hydrolase superfamily [Sanguibacter gelidistatuariae]|uniref:Lysophospholipase, alpha-beta hydrolase superfamily n=1 Tax=Sanguibacter gelidistatuariae TaxID=1814289 RepID=A0A1G6WYB9_9MICO|nr:alpha/beta hydrolase [Sanguibacter gelidistatuariae]SDD70046.1 Lysophospholipase, alpha-beta hydrolase superfamily [Sanguibacter gelidistatuariae]